MWGVRATVAVTLLACGCSARSAHVASPPPTTANRRNASTVSLSSSLSTTRTVEVDGVVRHYVMNRPEATGSQLPVLVELQGCCVDTAVEQQRSGFQAVTGPAIVVYPVPIDESWNAGTCCHDAQRLDVDDVGFVTTVVHDVVAHDPDADASRVYLAGYSNGGKLAFSVACTAPQLFAGIASYGAVSASACPSPAAVSLLEVASSGDPELTIDEAQPPGAFGYAPPSVRQQVAQYVAVDQCAGRADVTQGQLTSTTWSCADGRSVALALYDGGSHDWPEGNTTTPSAQKVMWDFLAPLRASSSVGR